MRLYRVSPLWKQGFQRDYQMSISSQVKSALWNVREGKHHHRDSFMLDASVLYKSCDSHLAKWIALFDEFPPFANNNWMGKWWTMWVVSAWYKSFCWWSCSKLFDQYQNLSEFVQIEHQPNAIHCKMMEHERWAKYFATYN